MSGNDVEYAFKTLFEHRLMFIGDVELDTIVVRGVQNLGEFENDFARHCGFADGSSIRYFRGGRQKINLGLDRHHRFVTEVVRLLARTQKYDEADLKRLCQFIKADADHTQKLHEIFAAAGGLQANVPRLKSLADIFRHDANMAQLHQNALKFTHDAQHIHDQIEACKLLHDHLQSAENAFLVIHSHLYDELNKLNPVERVVWHHLMAAQRTYDWSIQVMCEHVRVNRDIIRLSVDTEALIHDATHVGTCCHERDLTALDGVLENAHADLIHLLTETNHRLNLYVQEFVRKVDAERALPNLRVQLHLLNDQMDLASRASITELSSSIEALLVTKDRINEMATVHNTFQRVTDELRSEADGIRQDADKFRRLWQMRYRQRLTLLAAPPFDDWVNTLHSCIQRIDTQLEHSDMPGLFNALRDCHFTTAQQFLRVDKSLKRLCEDFRQDGLQRVQTCLSLLGGVL